ncbi:MAG: hypothetical protein L7U62_05365 [Candidatus Poseidoniaceae archaeon]|nr:hypothetical protein [Candidatus Poseidoniaceae archaeon]
MTDSKTEIWPEEKREDVDLGFSMKIDGHQPDAEMPTDLFAVRPDTRGPKTIGVLLILGALVLLGQAYGDIGLHSADDLSSEEVDLILDVPNSQGDGTNDVSSEQYQTFHDAARDSGGYAVRGYGLALASLLLIVGGVMLMFLNGTGAKLSVAGAGIGLVSGTAGSLMIKGAADEHLQGVLLLTYEITTYFCGVCMVMCLGLAALPLINARARMALYPQQKVKLSQHGEE